jgi:hypothetical protein
VPDPALDLSGPALVIPRETLKQVRLQEAKHRLRLK